MAALLALVIQLALGTLLGFAPICHDGEAGGNAPLQPTHMPPNCSVCSLCGTLASLQPTLVALPAVAGPATAVIASVAVGVEAAALPLHPMLAAQPRGPPSPV